MLVHHIYELHTPTLFLIIHLFIRIEMHKIKDRSPLKSITITLGVLVKCVGRNDVGVYMRKRLRWAEWIVGEMGVEEG